jgi:hypothetical protein
MKLVKITLIATCLIVLAYCDEPFYAYNFGQHSVVQNLGVKPAVRNERTLSERIKSINIQDDVVESDAGEYNSGANTMMGAYGASTVRSSSGKRVVYPEHPQYNVEAKRVVSSHDTNSLGDAPQTYEVNHRERRLSNGGQAGRIDQTMRSSSGKQVVYPEQPKHEQSDVKEQSEEVYSDDNKRGKSSSGKNVVYPEHPQYNVEMDSRVRGIESQDDQNRWVRTSNGKNVVYPEQLHFSGQIPGSKGAPAVTGAPNDSSVKRGRGVDPIVEADANQMNLRGDFNQNEVQARDSEAEVPESIDDVDNDIAAIESLPRERTIQEENDIIEKAEEARWQEQNRLARHTHVWRSTDTSNPENEVRSALQDPEEVHFEEQHDFAKRITQENLLEQPQETVGQPVQPPQEALSEPVYARSVIPEDPEPNSEEQAVAQDPDGARPVEQPQEGTEGQSRDAAAGRARGNPVIIEDDQPEEEALDRSEEARKQDQLEDEKNKAPQTLVEGSGNRPALRSIPINQVPRVTTADEEREEKNLINKGEEARLKELEQQLAARQRVLRYQQDHKDQLDQVKEASDAQLRAEVPGVEDVEAQIQEQQNARQGHGEHFPVGGLYDDSQDLSQRAGVLSAEN